MNTDSENMCPVCEKTYKHLLAHLKNKHVWSAEEIAQFKETRKPLFYQPTAFQEMEMLESNEESLSSPTAPVHPRNKLQGYENGTYDENEDLSKYASRKIDTDELMLKAVAKRGVETKIMHAFAHVKDTLTPTYDELERNITRLLLETEPAREEEVDGPRTDITKRVQSFLRPSFEYMQEKITHEIFSLADQLKSEIDLL